MLVALRLRRVETSQREPRAWFLAGDDARTWLDNAGRPHSEALHVQEAFHRLDLGNMELTVTIDDPMVYQKPWVALKNVRWVLMPPNTDLLEMLCSPSELARYNKSYAPASKKK